MGRGWDDKETGVQVTRVQGEGMRREGDGKKKKIHIFTWIFFGLTITGELIKITHPGTPNFLVNKFFCLYLNTCMHTHSLIHTQYPMKSSSPSSIYTRPTMTLSSSYPHSISRTTL